MRSGTRLDKALRMLNYHFHIKDAGSGKYYVQSQSSTSMYQIMQKDKDFECACPDFEKRGLECKHIIALKQHLLVMKHMAEEGICYRDSFLHPVIEAYYEVNGGCLTRDHKKITCSICKKILGQKIAEAL